MGGVDIHTYMYFEIRPPSNYAPPGHLSHPCFAFSCYYIVIYKGPYVEEVRPAARNMDWSLEDFVY